MATVGDASLRSLASCRFVAAPVTSPASSWMSPPARASGPPAVPTRRRAATGSPTSASRNAATHGSDGWLERSTSDVSSSRSRRATATGIAVREMRSTRS